jgi:hypothetical protein
MSRLMTTREIAESDEYPFTMNQIRNFLAKRNTNGLRFAIRSTGHVLYIDRADFEKWLRDPKKYQPNKSDDT